MNSPRIVEISAAQIPLIQELTQRVWPQTYQSIISREQIEFMLEMMYSTTSLQKQIEGGHHFLVIYALDEAVGFASYAKEKKADTFKLHKLYVLQEKQHLGYGKGLLLKVIDEVKKRNGTHLILQVNRTNKKAIAFYERNGFEIELSADFDIGNGYQMNDFIMGIQL
jgi:ribosomal protein S18 acetylase RimI-like enzyme